MENNNPLSDASKFMSNTDEESGRVVNLSANADGYFDRLSSSSLKCFTLLSLPDNVLLYIFSLVHQSKHPFRQTDLRSRKLEFAADSICLASTCTRLRNLLRGSVSSLCVSWDDQVGSRIVQFFAPGLSSLTISKHPKASDFVQGIFGTQLRVLKLICCPVKHVVLTSAIHRLRATLQEFSMISTTSADASDVNSSVTALSACRNLQSLSLLGIEGLTHSSFAGSLAEPLRELSFGSFYHGHLSDMTIHEIARRCPNLEAVALKDVTWAQPQTIVGMCETLGSQLLVASFENCSISDNMLRTIAEACPRICSLSVSDRHNNTSTVDGIVTTTRLLQPHLLSLKCDYILGVTNEAVREMIRATPRLVDLRLRHANLVTDSAIICLMQALKKTIEVLDVTGCAITDAGLRAIGQAAPAKLRIFHMGTRPLPTQQTVLHQPPLAGIIRNSWVSDEGINDMLKTTGDSLRRFQCESIPVRAGDLAGPCHEVTIAGIAKSLAAYCKNLDTCCLLNLCPPLSEFVERCRARQAISALEKVAPHCTVYIDRESPTVEPLSLEVIKAHNRAGMMTNWSRDGPPGDA